MATIKSSSSRGTSTDPGEVRVSKRKPTGRRLLREFQRGLSFIGLARKYGMTSPEVQARVRRVMRSA